MSSEAAPTLDGRTQRKARNVEAVLDAVHALFVEGHVDPPVEEVASRSGVSLRSIYRYFPDREQLVLAALGHRLVDAQHLFEVEGLGQGPLDERVERFVAHRLALHEAMAPIARVALVAARQMPVLASRITEARRETRALVDAHFAPELGRLDAGAAQELAEAVDLLCQFESVETLRVVRELEAERVRTVLVVGVGAVLARAAER